MNKKSRKHTENLKLILKKNKQDDKTSNSKSDK